MSNAKVKQLSEVTDLLRNRGGVEYQTAKYPLQPGQEDYAWRDYVRGKDLQKYLASQQELLDRFTRQQGPDRTQDDQITELMTKVMQAKLMSPADRKFKKAKPGKKKLVKWPKTLEHAEDALAWSEELFYVFNYDKPTGALFYVGAVLVVLAVLGCTLFPLAPYWFKLIVLRLLSGLLFVMLGTMLVRYVVWLPVWLATGAHFWILPNLMSETLPLPELFKPVLDYKPRDPNDKSSSLLVRGAVTAALAGCCWALLVLGPDAQTVKNTMQDTQDSVLKYFDMVDMQRGRLSNQTNTTGIDPSSKFAGAAGPGSKASSGASSGETEEEEVGSTGHVDGGDGSSDGSSGDEPPQEEQEL